MDNRSGVSTRSGVPNPTTVQRSVKIQSHVKPGRGARRMGDPCSRCYSKLRPTGSAFFFRLGQTSETVCTCLICSSQRSPSHPSCSPLIALLHLLLPPPPPLPSTPSFTSSSPFLLHLLLLLLLYLLLLHLFLHLLPPSSPSLCCSHTLRCGLTVRSPDL